MYKIVDAVGTVWTLDDIETSARNAELEDCKKQLEAQENRIEEDSATINNLNILIKSLEKALVNECNTADGLRTVLHKEFSILDSVHNRLQLMKEDKMDMHTALEEIGDLVYASMSDHVLDDEYARLRGINERLDTAIVGRDMTIKRQENTIEVRDNRINNLIQIIDLNKDHAVLESLYAIAKRWGATLDKTNNLTLGELAVIINDWHEYGGPYPNNEDITETEQ